MGNELVGNLFSQSKGAKKAPFSYKEIFEEQAPYFLSIGMTADEYWNKDPDLTRQYMKAYELRVEHENFNAYLQGLYNYKAIVCSAPAFDVFAHTRKPIPYDDEPIPITKKMAEEKAEREQNKWIENIKARADAHNKLLEERDEDKKNV